MFAARVVIIRLLVIGPILMAQTPAAAPGKPAAPHATPQRPTFTSDTSTTAPGTVELETGITASGQFVGVPTTIKYTPEVGGGILHEAEWSVSFDGVTSVSIAGDRVTHFGDQIGLIFRRPVWRGRSVSIAVAPRSFFFLRGASGARLGIATQAAYQFGLNGLVGNVRWTAATHPSAGNPAHRYEAAFDFIRTLGEDGVLSRFSVFAGMLYEKARSVPAEVTLAQGLSYRARPQWVLDFAVRQRGVAAGPREIRFLAGLTTNLGRLAR